MVSSNISTVTLRKVRQTAQQSRFHTRRLTAATEEIRATADRLTADVAKLTEALSFLKVSK